MRGIMALPRAPRRPLTPLHGLAGPRRTALRIGLGLSLGLLTPGPLRADPAPAFDAAGIQAPPTPPPPVLGTLHPAPAGTPRNAALAAGAVYSIGEPSDEEQLYVEYINRARAEPQAEATRFVTTTDIDILNAYRAFSVDLPLLTEQFASIAPAPPISINARLTEAARLHSRDMFDHEFQGHTGTDGSDLGERLSRQGYSYQTAGENVFSTSKNPWYGHAGFDVDWGAGPGGMQTPPGHRNSIHNAAYREVGVGVVLGKTTKVGPELVTQDFASPFNATPFLTGVVYYDFNGNQFYDLGEGISGVTVRASNTPTHAVTSRSGGYSIPVAGNGVYTVTFQVPGLEDITRQVAVTGNANVKVDHRPPYSPPVLGGASVAPVGRATPYVIAPVAAATAYDWRSLERNPWTTADGAEEGLARFEASTSPGYNVIASDVRRSGTSSFHLAHPAPPANQYLTLREPIQLGAASQLVFWSRLGFAAAGQTARVQISTDDGRTWVDLWTRTGTGTAGEANFSQHTIPLSAYAGRVVGLRFAFIFGGGSYFPQTSAGVGWYLDDILVSEAESLGGEVIQPATGTAFEFRPAVEGLYLLQARARIGDRILSWGPDLRVTAQQGSGEPDPIVIRLGALSRGANGSWTLGFRVEQGSPVSLEVEEAGSLEGPWTEDPSARIEPAGIPSEYRALLAPGTDLRRFLRVLAR